MEVQSVLLLVGCLAIQIVALMAVLKHTAAIKRVIRKSLEQSTLIRQSLSSMREKYTKSGLKDET